MTLRFFRVTSAFLVITVFGWASPVFAQTSPATTPPAATGNTDTFLVPSLAVPIPGVTFSAPTDGEGGLSIPFLMQYISGAYRFAITLGMLAAIIMVMWGGFRYLAGATIDSTKRGKEIIENAIAGFAILLAATSLLSTINPMTVKMSGVTIPPVSTERAEDTDSAYDDETGQVRDNTATPGGGPTSLCRQNLRPSGHAWCAACNVACEMRATQPDNACLNIINGAPPCGGSFGYFLKALTDNCQSKRFYWLDGLDGITFGILHSTEDNIPSLMRRFQSVDSAGFQTAMGDQAGHALDPSWLCNAQREQHGVICDQNFRAAMERALASRGFMQAQLQDAFAKYQRRIQLGAAHFHSEFGQLMWAVALNNPGACGANFAPILQACSSQFAGDDENAKIECFLDQFPRIPCRGSAAGAARRASSIRNNLANASKTNPPTPVTLETVMACIH